MPELVEIIAKEVRKVRPEEAVEGFNLIIFSGRIDVVLKLLVS